MSECELVRSTHIFITRFQHRDHALGRLQTCPLVLERMGPINVQEMRPLFLQWQAEMMEACKSALKRRVELMIEAGDLVIVDGAEEEKAVQAAADLLEDDGAWQNLSDFHDVRVGFRVHHTEQW